MGSYFAVCVCDVYRILPSTNIYSLSFKNLLLALQSVGMFELYTRRYSIRHSSIYRKSERIKKAIDLSSLRRQLYRSVCTIIYYDHWWKWRVDNGKIYERIYWQQKIIKFLYHVVWRLFKWNVNMVSRDELGAPATLSEGSAVVFWKGMQFFSCEKRLFGGKFSGNILLDKQ